MRSLATGSSRSSSKAGDDPVDLGLLQHVFADHHEVRIARFEKGELSKEEAEEKLSQYRRKRMGDEENEDDIGSVKRRYMGLVRRLKEAVESGDLSEEEAERKMIQMRREMFDEDDERRDEEGMEALKRRYLGMVERVKAAVKRGELSEEEAERKLLELKREWFDKD